MKGFLFYLRDSPVKGEVFNKIRLKRANTAVILVESAVSRLRVARNLLTLEMHANQSNVCLKKSWFVRSQSCNSLCCKP